MVRIVSATALPDIVAVPRTWLSDEEEREIDFTVNEKMVLIHAPSDGLTWADREAAAWEAMEVAANELAAAAT